MRNPGVIGDDIKELGAAAQRAYDLPSLALQNPHDRSQWSDFPFEAATLLVERLDAPVRDPHARQ
jgi:hypothetical protein